MPPTSDRRAVHQVSIQPTEEGFELLVDGELVMCVEAEIEAHHWAKHLVECVNSGITSVAWIRQELPERCRRATILNLHTGYPAAS